MKCIAAVHNILFEFSKICVCFVSFVQNSGIESLVEELCSKLKDIQNKQKGLVEDRYYHLEFFYFKKNRKKLNNNCSNKLS